MNTTHTVRFEVPPSRAFRLIVGVGVLYAIYACWGLVYSTILSWISPFAGSEDAGLGSITGVLLPLLIEFLIFVGTVSIFIATVGWRVIADVVSGIVQTVRTMRAQSVAVQHATASATEAAQVRAAMSAGAAAGNAAVTTAVASVPAPAPPAPEPTFEDKVRATFSSQHKRLNDMDTKLNDILTAVTVQKAPAKRTTATRAKTTAKGATAK